MEARSSHIQARKAPTEAINEEHVLKYVKLLRYSSVSIDHPEAVVAKFCEENGLSYTKHFFHWMLKPLEAAAENPEEKAEKFEKIRKENHERRQRNAAAKKKKAQTT